MREREVRPGVERQEDRLGAQCHEDRPTDENEVANSSNVNPGVVNYKQRISCGMYLRFEREDSITKTENS